MQRGVTHETERVGGIEHGDVDSFRIHVANARVAVEFAAGVLGLVHSVGIHQHHVARLQPLGDLAIFVVCAEAQRQAFGAVQDSQGPVLAAFQSWRVMAGAGIG